MNRLTALRKNRIALYLLIFVFALIFRLYNIEYRNVWGDEDCQSTYAGQGLFDLDMPKNSSSQQQPPVDPLIQSIGISNFGMSEIGIRIHTAVLGALSVLFFYIMMCKVMENRFAVFLASIIFAFHPWLIRYSRVGRPVGTGVFFAVLYLFVLLHFLVHARDKKTKTQTFILLIIVQTWFFISVGFQPLIFLLTSSLSLFPFLFYKKYFYKTALVYLSGIISFSLVYPILRLSIERGSQIYLTQASFLENVGTVFKNLTSITFKTYTWYFASLVGEYKLLFFIVLILGVAGLIHAIVSRKKYSNFLLFLYFFIFTLVYPLVFDSIFKALIKYNIKTRYHLTFTPVLIASLGLGIYYGLSFFSHLLGNKYKRRVRYLPHGFLLIIFLFSFYGNTQNLKEVYMLQNREWKKVFNLFKYHSTPGDTAYIINLTPPGKWVPTTFRAQKFYYRDETERHVRLEGKGSIVDDYQNIRAGKQRGDIYFVFLYGSGILKKLFFKNLDVVSLRRYRKVCVAHLRDNGRLPENISDFFYCLADNLPKRKFSYIVYETLFNLQMANGRLMKAKRHLNTLVRIDTAGKLKAKIEEFRKRWQSEMKKRKRIIEKRKNKRNLKK